MNFYYIIFIAFALAIDALAVGFSIGMINEAIFLPAIIIGIVASGMTILGIKLGVLLFSRFGQKISIIGGIVLILIGVQIVLEHLNIIVYFLNRRTT